MAVKHSVEFEREAEVKKKNEKVTTVTLVPLGSMSVPDQRRAYAILNRDENEMRWHTH